MWQVEVYFFLQRQFFFDFFLYLSFIMNKCRLFYTSRSSHVCELILEKAFDFPHSKEEKFL